MVNPFFTWLFESSIILAPFAIAYQCLLRRLTFFELNRAYLLLSILCSFLLPLFATSYFETAFGGFVASQQLNIDLTFKAIQGSIDAKPSAIAQVENHGDGFNLYLLLKFGLVFYLTGFLYRAIQFIRSLISVCSLLRKGAKKVEKGYTVVRMDANVQAFSFLHFIFLPDQDNDLNAHDIKQILHHEQVHVKEKHTLDLLLYELAGIIWWFHPFIYSLKLYVREAHEYLADLMVTKETDDPKQYGKLLIKLSARTNEPILNTFSNKQITQRINMLTQTKSNPMEKLKFLSFIPVLAVSLLLCSYVIDTRDQGQGSVNAKLNSREISSVSDQPVTIRKITWLGNTIFNDAELGRALALKIGDVYDAEDINRRLSYNPGGADISSLYMDRGYLFFNVTPKEVIAGNAIDLALVINEGQVVNIGKIIIKGNEKVPVNKIMEAIDFKIGDLFNRSKLIRSQKNIAELGYFNPKNVVINPVPYQKPGGEWVVDIEFAVEEI